jgi:hypothetical protein
MYQRRYDARRWRPLGDDTGDGSTVPVATDDTAAWQQSMLQVQQAQYAWLQEQGQEAVKQKWIQIATTAAIPIFASLWKWFQGRRGRNTEL